MKVNEIFVIQQDILIVGDFNLHCELNSVPGVKVSNEILAENNLKQHRLGDNMLIQFNRVVNYSILQQHIRSLQCHFPFIVCRNMHICKKNSGIAHNVE